MTNEIKINGIKELNEEEQSIVNKIVNHKLEKIERQIKNDFSLTALVKAYEKDGKQKKYSVDFTLQIGKHYLKSKDTDWELAKALNKGLEKIQTEIEHKLHVSDQK